MIQQSIAHMTPMIDILSDDQKFEIHRAAMDVLQKTGYKVLNARARDLLEKNGARVVGDIVYAPEGLVMDCVRMAPGGFTLYDRLGNRAMEVEGRKVYFSSSWASPTTRDALTGEVHPTTVEDIRRGAIITNNLPNIDFATPMGSCQDVPSICADLYEFETVVTNTTKPIFCIPYSFRGLQLVYEMAATVAGGWDELAARPFIVTYPEPITPLVCPEDIADKVMWIAEKGMPCMYTPIGQAGLTSPVTLAGTLVVNTAEILFGNMIAQLSRRGTPYIFAGCPQTVDMSTVTYVETSPEMNLMYAALADMGRHYGMPTWGTAGVTDSKAMDMQAGIEGTFSLMAQALNGINLIHDVGYVDMAMANSAEMLVMGDEVIGMIKRFMGGVAVNRNTLCRDIIEKVGPGGNYIMERHTLQNFREEHWMPTMLDRMPRSNWETAGSVDMEAKIKAKIKNLLDNPTAPALPDDVLAKLKEIRIEGEKELVAAAALD